MNQYSHLKPSSYRHLTMKALNWFDGSRDAVRRYQDYMESDNKPTPSAVEVEGLFVMVCSGITPEHSKFDRSRTAYDNVAAIFGPEFTPEQEAEFAALFECAEVTD